MPLRSYIERHLSVEEGEERLSPDANSSVFVGDSTTGEIVEVRASRNYAPGSAYNPYRLYVTRENKDGRRTVSRRVGGPEYLDAAAEMRDPAKLARANRAERRARRITAATFVAGAVAVGALLVGMDVAVSSGEHQTGDIKGCEQVVDGAQPLLPVSEAQAEQLQQAGEPVCMIAGHEYEVGDR